jgi:hypothetical protein
MQLTRHLLGGLLGLALCAGSLGAEAPPSPLRLIPPDADLVVQIKGLRPLAESVSSLDYFKELLTLDGVKQLLDSTQARRLNQMLAYFEKELGVSRTEMLDRLGGPAALAAKLGDKAPALFVLQAKDEKLLKKFTALALDVLGQELARQGAKERPVKENYKTFETVRIGQDLHAAVAGSALLLSNRAELLRRGLDLASSPGKSLADHAGLKEAAALLPKESLASLWVNMEPVRKAPGADALYKKPRDPVLTVLFGGWADIAGRAPFLCAGLVREPKGLLLTFRFPRGLEGMGPDRAVNCAPDGAAGPKPLLEPKGVLFSTSFYMDLSKYWTERHKLFGEKQVQVFEQADKGSGRFLSNIRISKLLTQAGARHRFVAAYQEKTGYKKQPKTVLPAFAFVAELRKPDEFAQTMEGVLRGVALFGGNQAGLKLAEEKYKGCKLVAYRFDEERTIKQDVNDLRFNFSPCFAKVEGHFFFCSTIELGRELIDLLQAEAKMQSKPGPTINRTRLYSSGGVALLKSFEDQLVTQTILSQAVPLEEARAQVQALLSLLSRTSGISLETTYAPKEFHYDIRLNFTK